MVEASLVFDSAQLRAAVANFRPAMQRELRASLTVNGRRVEKELEAATAAVGLGRLSRAWASKVHPDNGRLSDSPKASIFLNGADRTQGAISAYVTGATIRGKQGQYLAIPLPAAGSRSTGRGRAPLTPGEWERRTGLRLRFVYRRNKPSLLVLDEGVLSGKKGRARLNTERRRKTGRGNQTIPIFVLIRQVVVNKRFDVKSIEAAGQKRFEQDFTQRLNKLIVEFNKGGRTR